MSDAQLKAYGLFCAEKMRACHHHDAEQAHRWFQSLANVAMEQDKRPLFFHQGAKQ